KETQRKLELTLVLKDHPRSYGSASVQQPRSAPVPTVAAAQPGPRDQPVVCLPLPLPLEHAFEYPLLLQPGARRLGPERVPLVDILEPHRRSMHRFQAPKPGLATEAVAGLSCREGLGGLGNNRSRACR